MASIDSGIQTSSFRRSSRWSTYGAQLILWFDRQRRLPQMVAAFETPEPEQISHHFRRRRETAVCAGHPPLLPAMPAPTQSFFQRRSVTVVTAERAWSVQEMVTNSARQLPPLPQHWSTRPHQRRPIVLRLSNLLLTAAPLRRLVLHRRLTQAFFPDMCRLRESGQTFNTILVSGRALSISTPPHMVSLLSTTVSSTFMLRRRRSRRRRRCLRAARRAGPAPPLLRASGEARCPIFL